MSSLSTYIGGGDSTPVDGLIDGPLFSKPGLPLLDTNSALYMVNNPYGYVRATSRAQRSNWYKRARKYMQFDQHSAKMISNLMNVNTASFMYSCESFMLRAGVYGMMHSSDGVEWSHCDFDMPTTTSSIITFGNVNTKVARIGNTWFLYSNPGDTTARIYKSTDGLHWTVASVVAVPTSHIFMSFSSANNKLFLGFTINTTTARMITSSDGVIWNECTLPANANPVYYGLPVAWNGTVYCFCTDTSDTSLNKSYYSTDGVNWILGTTAFSRSAGSNGSNDLIVFNGKFIRAFYNVSTGASNIWTSSDGSVWTNTQNISGAIITGFIVSPGMVVAFGNSSMVYTTTDGTTWTSQTYGVTGQNLVAGAWDGSRFVLCSVTTNAYRTSTDGVTWSAGGTISGLIAANSRGDIAVAFNGDTYVHAAYTVVKISGSTVTTCVNGQLSATSQYSRTIVRGGNRIVYVNSTGVYLIDLTSLDHKTRLGISGSFNAVIYGNGRFVAVGTNIVAYSDDGVNWSSVALTGSHISVGYGNGLWMIMTANSSNYFTSTDTANWTPRALGYTPNANWVMQFASGFWTMFLNNSSQFIGSSDGITWTLVSGLNSSQRLINIADRHIFYSKSTTDGTYIATGHKTLSLFRSADNNRVPILGYNSKYGQFIAYGLGSGGGLNDNAFYKAEGQAGRDSWNTGNSPSGSFNASSYGILVTQGSNSYNINTGSQLTAMLQIPDTGTMLLLGTPLQIAFVDGAQANTLASISYCHNTAEFILSRNYDCGTAWSDDGSLYAPTNDNGNPFICRLQLGLIYAQSHLTLSSATYQYRRVG